MSQVRFAWQSPMEGERILRWPTSVPAPMRQTRYIRTVSVFSATVISLVIIFSLLKSNFRNEAESEVKFTGSVPSRPVVHPSSVEFVQPGSSDSVAALLVEPRAQSRETPREVVPLPRPRPRRL
jgi:hypothetical protein